MQRLSAGHQDVQRSDVAYVPDRWQRLDRHGVREWMQRHAARVQRVQSFERPHLLGKQRAHLPRRRVGNDRSELRKSHVQRTDTDRSDLPFGQVRFRHGGLQWLRLQRQQLPDDVPERNRSERQLLCLLRRLRGALLQRRHDVQQRQLLERPLLSVRAAVEQQQLTLRSRVSGHHVLERPLSTPLGIVFGDRFPSQRQHHKSVRLRRTAPVHAPGDRAMYR